ncbi:hypothetical protein H4582DRAFT_1903365 [Lactarius indigo]|nr:hypothetical protein H4582DRAFT_1903365 [Lactarius indigo]
MVVVHDDDLERILGVGDGSSPETLQSDVMMNHLERSQLEIGVMSDPLPSNDQSPRTATEHVRVAVLSEQLKSLDHPSSVLLLSRLAGLTNRDESAQYDDPSGLAPLAATPDLDAFVDAFSKLGLHGSGGLPRHRQTEYPTHTRSRSGDEKPTAFLFLPPSPRSPLQPTDLIGGDANARHRRTVSCEEWLTSRSSLHHDLPTMGQSSSSRPLPQTLPTNFLYNFGAASNVDLTTYPLARQLQPYDTWSSLLTGIDPGDSIIGTTLKMAKTFLRGKSFHDQQRDNHKYVSTLGRTPTDARARSCSVHLEEPAVPPCARSSSSYIEHRDDDRPCALSEAADNDVRYADDSPFVGYPPVRSGDEQPHQQRRASSSALQSKCAANHRHHRYHDDDQQWQRQRGRGYPRRGPSDDVQ